MPTLNLALMTARWMDRRFSAGVFAQYGEPATQRLLIEQRIDAVAEEAETAGGVLARPGFVHGQECGRLAARLAGGEHPLDAFEIFRMVELPRDAQEIGEIELADPQRVDARYRGDRLDVPQAFVGFDLDDGERSLVQR